ncbi:MAG: kinase [Caulobacterales bacterium]
MDALISLLDDAARDLIKIHKRPVRIGVSGAQGSGKSTFALAWAKANPKVAHFSLDDVYLTTKQRLDLAATVSPLLKTRGPAGTHDLELAKRTFRQLASARARDTTPLPRFDKVADQPVKSQAWPLYIGTPNVMLIEGWCIGAAPEPDDLLQIPINDLEVTEDADGRWRAFVNQRLGDEYAAFFAQLDLIVHFKAPHWDVVPGWRRQQEAGLRKLAVEKLPPEVLANLDRFVMHFERVTRHMLASGCRADWTVVLDEDRVVRDIVLPG